ncbi:hypothetical protein B0H63DRAFT_559612 [Podospora didyma]|uniref:IgE-binding protein n=1 Tax=Podospora didyma TaxID=330526 RepID=A0AAE0TZ43_9PEZI|nr:hypothetical protein B0H63DRAFT_559612 [Podospora didyma]
MFSLFTLLAITTAAVSAGYPPPPGPWAMGAWRPPTDPPAPLWLGRAIQANGGRFWMGKPPSAYCPPDIPGLNCTLYPGTSTVLVGGNETLSLNVVVPGGQQVYIAPDGALGYTPPHSTFKPDGSVVTGWRREISDAGGAPTVLWNQAGGYFVACPVGDAKDDVYQIYLNSGDALSGAACVSFQMRTYTAAGAVAWEY